MKSRVRVYIVVLIVLVVVAIFAIYGSAELSALAWHVRHGFHAELGGVRVRVPVFFEANDPLGTSTLVIMRNPSAFRQGGIILVDFGRHRSPEAEQAAEAKFAKRDLFRQERVGERDTTFAGRPGKCIESVPVFDEPRYQRLLSNAHGIDCWFGDDVKATFIGSANLTDDFYRMIQTAEAVKGKH